MDGIGCALSGLELLQLVKKMTRIAIVTFFAAALAIGVRAQEWRPMGPPGGDVRTLASDPSNPKRIFLGTSDGHVFGSTDGGEHWALLGRAGTRQDSVITSIVIDPDDPQVAWASAWTQDPSAGGAIYRSEDGGIHWKVSGLEGHAVRALAEAPSNHNLLVAGAVDGAFRSRNGGRTWDRISPEDNEELRNLDSIAIDPKDEDVIYIGTYHLPWKTSDGGRSWAPIHEGMIDDSDVMSLAVDRTNPSRVYASACSGIYLSQDGAGVWRKIQGIPYSARRTQVILQDEAAPSVVYAATTEGLWRTSASGAAWARISPANWVINAVTLVPDSEGSHRRIVIGTERLGVLISDDDGQTFHESNSGFYHRQIVALALDHERPGRVLAVVTNTPEPILATENGGRTWEALGPGLGLEGMRHVFASPTGWWATLEHGGWMRYDADKSAWRQGGWLTPEAASEIAAAEKEQANEKTAPRHERVQITSNSEMHESVNDMAFSHAAWYAATDHGLLRSVNLGVTWSLQPLGPMATLPVRAVRVSADGKNLWVVSLRGLVFSRDAGKNWAWHDLPLSSGGALWLDVAEGGTSAADLSDETIVAGTEKGLYISRDSGDTWRAVGAGLPQAELQDLAIEGSTFLASMRAGGLYLSRDRGENWTRVTGLLAEGFFPVVTTEEQATTLFAASATEGLYAVLIAPAAHPGIASTAASGGVPH